ncbi:MAG: NFACT family protein [Rhodothermia bacterium]|nr:MAG: NFACT family protein [Rhodothermia bacterium]
MLTNYYTLSQLVNEWQSWIEGATVDEIYSQQRGELIVALRDSQGELRALQISVQAPLRYLSCTTNASRARKNVASVFSTAEGLIVKNLSIDPSDRLIDLAFVDGSGLRIELFGPASNVYRTDGDGIVVERFRKKGIEIRESVTHPSQTVPFAETLVAAEGNLGKRVRKANPLLGSIFAAEVILDAGLDAETKASLSSEQVSALEASRDRLVRILDSPSPRIFWKGTNAHLFSLLPLTLEGSLREELFETTDEAVRIYIRRKLSQTAYDREHAPLERAISTRLKKAVRSHKRLLKEVDQESRAETYERYGHLLMASQQDVESGQDSVTLDDIIAGGGKLTIALRSELSAVQNAERYYERARESRQARIHAKKRLSEMGELVNQLQELHAELNEAETAAEVTKFKKRNASALAAVSSQRTGVDTQVPYRRYLLSDGYEVWVGKNAKQNDKLTTQEARKYDLWLHARGVTGSHTVLRVPRRQETPPARIVEKAAAIAAWHSKARTSELAPVIVAEKRYVRKPRKSPLGTVVVEREKVLIVKPEIPEG